MAHKTKKQDKITAEEQTTPETIATEVVETEIKSEVEEPISAPEKVEIIGKKFCFGEEKKNLAWIAATSALIIASVVLYCRNNNLANRISVLEQHVSKVENTVSQNVDNNRRIYIFNMDEAVQNTGVKDANQKFEEDINELDAQVKDAQATIKSIKDEAVKAKMLNLTLKPLQMKRDDLLEAYSRAMQESLIQINEALAEYATENNIPTIFINKSVAVNTNYVIDVTPGVVEKIKAKQQPK